MHTSFIQSESGAVTVDWVVLTAGLVGLGLAVSSVIGSGVQDLSTDIDRTLTDMDVISTGFLPQPNTGYTPFRDDMVTAITQALATLERETLEEGYANAAAQAKAAIEAGNQLQAQNSLDTMTANANALALNDFDLPENAPSVDDLYSSYVKAGLNT